MKDIIEELCARRRIIALEPCGCSGPCDEEGLVMEHQCPRCAKIQAIDKKLEELGQ